MSDGEVRREGVPSSHAVRLLPDTIDAVRRHASAEYPEECCGIVTGNAAEQRVHACRNIQNRLHAEDPERHPRDARSAYAIDRAEFDRIVSEAAYKDESIIAFYHSHIDCAAYFSRMDKDVQTVFGEPEFPGAVQIVISVNKREVGDIKAFGWNKEREDFIPLPIDWQ